MSPLPSTQKFIEAQILSQISRTEKKINNDKEKTDDGSEAVEDIDEERRDSC